MRSSNCFPVPGFSMSNTLPVVITNGCCGRSARRSWQFLKKRKRLPRAPGRRGGDKDGGAAQIQCYPLPHSRRAKGEMVMYRIESCEFQRSEGRQWEPGLLIDDGKHIIAADATKWIIEILLFFIGKKMPQTISSNKNSTN